MADDSQVTLRDINWREAFPFTNLFRGFRVAVHPSKLMLGLMLLLGLYIGGRVLDAVWSNNSKANYAEVLAYEQYRYQHDPAESFEAQRDLTRIHHITEYADRLQAAGVVSDREQAVDAARHGKYLSDLLSRQIDLRNQRDARDREGAKRASRRPTPM